MNLASIFPTGKLRIGCDPMVVGEPNLHAAWQRQGKLSAESVGFRYKFWIDIMTLYSELVDILERANYI